MAHADQHPQAFSAAIYSSVDARWNCGGALGARSVDAHDVVTVRCRGAGHFSECPDRDVARGIICRRAKWGSGFQIYASGSAWLLFDDRLKQGTSRAVGTSQDFVAGFSKS